MNIVWNSRTTVSTLSKLNHSVLDLIIPDIYQEIKQKSSSLQIQNPREPREPREPRGNEKLTGTKIPLESSISTKRIEKDVDINSADRKNWSNVANALMTPYNFHVVLGASDTFEGIATEMHLKNVVGAKMTHVIIADNDDFSIDTYPYLYLQIDEFHNVFQSRSTSHHGELSFVKLIRDKKWNASTNSNIRYNILNTKGTGAIASTGYQVTTPISNVTKLTFKILTPNGHILESHQDLFSIQEVSETTETLEIKMNACFVTNALHVDNVVGFQNINIVDGNIAQFLHDNEHTVLSVTGDRTIAVQKNVISRDPTSGIPTYENYGLSTSLVASTGNCMNFSLQTNIGLNIKMIRANNTNSETIYEM